MTGGEVLDLSGRVLCANESAVGAADFVALYIMASAVGQQHALLVAAGYLCGIVILLELDEGSLNDRICVSALESTSDVIRG